MKYFLFFVLLASIELTAQEVMGVFDGFQATFIGNDKLVVACNNCLDGDQDGIKFFNRSVAQWEEYDIFSLRDLSSTYDISEFEVSHNGNSLCLFLEKSFDPNQPSDPNSDMMICYSKEGNGWIESFLKQDITFQRIVYFSYYKCSLSDDGMSLVVTFPDPDPLQTSLGGTQRLITEFYEFENASKTFELKQELRTRIATNLGLTQFISHEGNHIVVSARGVLGWYENQFIHFSLKEGTWSTEDNSFGVDQLLKSASVIDANPSFSKVIFPIYVGTSLQQQSPEINMFDWNGTSWLKGDYSYSTYITSIVHSISLSDNGRFAGIGYINTDVGFMVSGPDSISYIDLVEYDSLGFSLLNRFTFNKNVSNQRSGITNFVEISSDASMLLVNNGEYQWLVYSISDLTGVEVTNPPLSEDIVMIDLYPNPTDNFVNFGLLEYEQLKVYNSLGQLVMASNNYLPQIEINNFPPGHYQLVFWIGDKPRYMSRIVKI